MSGRGYVATWPCAEGGGCRETISLQYDTRAAEAEGRKFKRDHPWKCSRHDKPAEYLQPGNEATERVLVATRLPSGEGEWLPGLYWIPEGGTTGSGYAFGPGFSAKAKEFPEGTRLVISARVEIPDAHPGPAAPEPRLSEWCESGIAHVLGVDEEGEGGYIASGHSWCDLKGGCGCPCHAEAAAGVLANPF